MEHSNYNPESVGIEAVRPPQEKKNPAHLPAIDGLRGLAAMMVVFFHAWGMNGFLLFPQFSLFGVAIPVYKLFTPGYSGVYLFFVLSGFCLSYPFLANPGRKDDWPGYALNRVRRILPPYLISFVILFLIGQWLHQWQVLPGEKFLFEPFKTNRFIKELFLIQKSRVCASYWTLVLEWRWYLLFPALLILARRVSPAIVVAVLYVIAYFAQKPFFSGPLHNATFLPLVTLLPVFAFGIWAAHLTARPRERLQRWERGLLKGPLWGLVAGLFWAVLLSPSVRPGETIKLATLWQLLQPMGVQPPSWVGSSFEFAIVWGPLYFFLMLAALNHPGLRRIFGSKPFVKLGMVSYSIYLLQEPVIRAGHYFIDRPEHGPLRLLAHHYLLTPALCVLAGWAFYYIGERPFLKRSKR
jgi:peptidoglycan/LPS O-acetylase OafA/YrhL